MEYRLKEILQDKGYIRGPFGSSLKRNELKNEGIPVYEQQHAIYATREFRYYIDEEKYSKMKRFTVKPNDLIISCSGTIGKVDLISEKDKIGIISQALLILRANTDIVLPEYLFYFFKSDYGYNSIISRSMGSVQVNLAKREVIENIKINIPKIEEQEKIVNILSNIDKKIKLNNKINDCLSKISQLALDNFIKENKNIDYCMIKDLNPKLETGRRPSGGVGNIIDGIPSIGAESIKGIGYFDYSKTKYVTENYFEKMKKGIVKGYELLIYKDGGKPGYFMPNFSMFGEGFPYEKCAINEHVFLLDFNDIRFNIFSYYYFNSKKIRHKLHVLGSKSAAIPGINQQDILNLEIPHVRATENKELLDIMEFNTKKIMKNSKQNFILSQLRDSLLPKLMNGKINLDKIEI